MPPTPTDEQQERQPRPRRAATPYIPPPPNGIDGRDVRAKKPPLLSFLLRMETLRHIARIVSLLALDLGGVVLAIFTALALKAAVRDEFDFTRAWHGTKDIVAFAGLVTVLLFA